MKPPQLSNGCHQTAAVMLYCTWRRPHKQGTVPLTSGTRMRMEGQPLSLSCLKQSLQAEGWGGMGRGGQRVWTVQLSQQDRVRPYACSSAVAWVGGSSPDEAGMIHPHLQEGQDRPGGAQTFEAGGTSIEGAK